MKNKRKYLGASLREVLDADLIQAVQNIDSTTKSEIVRQGARIVLGISTQKVQEIVQRPVPRPTLFFKNTLR